MHAVITGGVSLHVRTCTPRFCISGTARPIVFKFDVVVIAEVLNTAYIKLINVICMAHDTSLIGFYTQFHMQEGAANVLIAEIAQNDE